MLPIPGSTLQARYSGPYCVEEKLSEVNYVIKTPDRRWQHRMCHTNMLKQYYDCQEILMSLGKSVQVTGHSERG